MRKIPASLFLFPVLIFRMWRNNLKLALKFSRAKRKSLARFTSVVAVVGIAVGVASLIAAQSLARGFQDEMREKILANTAHIVIFRGDGAEITNWETVGERIAAARNVTEISPASFSNAVLITKQTNYYALLQTTKTAENSHRSNDGSETFSEKTERNGNQIRIIVGKELARKSNLSVGDEAEILTFSEQNAPLKTVVSIDKISETGLFEYDSTRIIVAPEDFAALNGKDYFVPTILNVSLDDIYAANLAAAEIQKTLGAEFRALSWQEANQPLFAALSLERKVSLAIVSLIIFIAVLNITTTLALLINERKADIAILRTCGAKTADLMVIFLIEGLFLGLSGIFSGLFGGLLICCFGNRFQLIKLNAEVYSLSSVSFRPAPGDIILIVLIAFVLTLAATVFPAYRAAKIKPSENLRVG